MRQSKWCNRSQRQDDASDSIDHGNVDGGLVFAEETIRYYRPKERKEVGKHDESVVDHSGITFVVEEVVCEVQTKNS